MLVAVQRELCRHSALSSRFPLAVFHTQSAVESNAVIVGNIDKEYGLFYVRSLTERRDKAVKTLSLFPIYKVILLYLFCVFSLLQVLLIHRPKQRVVSSTKSDCYDRLFAEYPYPVCR